MYGQQHLQQEVSFVSAALQEERFRVERLEEQINDLTELHQNEVENLKQNIIDMEEKVQYQSEERLRDIHDLLDSCHTRVSFIIIYLVHFIFEIRLHFITYFAFYHLCFFLKYVIH